MPPQIKINGKYVVLTEYIKTHVCEKCGQQNGIALIYMPTNQSIQLKCPQCRKWFGNLKYDFSGERNAASP